MPIVFAPLPTATARQYQSGGVDANGHSPERLVSDGNNNPCRHCLCMIPAGAAMLLLAHRPFPGPQPYAELGPIFLCAEPCEAPEAKATLPAMLSAPDHILRGYSADHRIVPGSGAVVPTSRIAAEADLRLADPRVAYAHVRSASNNCYLVRIERG